MNNNNLINSNKFKNNLNNVIKENQNGTTITILKPDEQVALHALLELSLEAAKSELKAENVNSNASRMNMLKTFIRGQTTGIVNNNNNYGFAPPTPKR